MTMHNDTHTLLRRIAHGHAPTENELGKLNGLQAAVREFAAMPADQRRTQGYDHLAKMGASRGEIALILDDDSKAAKPLMLDTIGGGELYDREFPPLQFLWDGVIARGHCAVIAGRPKSGKSFLLLQLAQAIDTGVQFIGKPTTRARVLYLALEDGARRIHQRIHTRHWRPQSTTFAFSIQPLDAGGLDQLRETVKAGGFEVVILDTLRAAISAKVDENSNSEMAAVLYGLAGLAHDDGVSVIASHHTTKTATEDPFDAIRGAGAIRGAYDVGLVLQRKQKEREALLCVESRDIEAADMTISFDGATGWSYEGDANKLDDIRAGRKVVKALQDIGDTKTLDELASAMGITPQAAGQQLRAAESQGLVKRTSAPTDGKARKPKDLWSLAP